MEFDIQAGFGEGHALTFEEFSLERCVRLANQEFAAGAYDAMPGDAFSRGAGGHGAACSPASAREAQRLSERPIG